MIYLHLTLDEMFWHVDIDLSLIYLLWADECYMENFVSRYSRGQETLFLLKPKRQVSCESETCKPQHFNI